MIGDIIQDIIEAEKKAGRIRADGESRAKKIGTDAQLKIDQMREQSNQSLTEEFKARATNETNTSSSRDNTSPALQKEKIDKAAQFVINCIMDGAK